MRRTLVVNWLFLTLWDPYAIILHLIAGDLAGQKGTMHKLGKRLGVGVIFFLMAVMPILAAQNPGAPAGKPSEKAVPAVVNHAQAYYHFMLARRYKELAGVYNSGDYIDRALSEYQLAIAADPQSLFLRVELAELYWRVSRIGDAIREAEDVLKTDPDYPDAHRLLARVYWHMLGDNQTDQSNKQSLHKALEHMEALTRLDPSDTDSWLVLGRLYKLANQGQKAEESFKKALSLDPNSSNGLSTLAQFYFEQGDYQGAIDLLKKIPVDSMDPALLGMLGYAYSQTHDYASAVAVFEKALAQDPENQDIRRSYADALVGMGNGPAARAEFGKVLKADPNDAASNLRLAQLDRQDGRFDQARKELDRARTLQPDNVEITYQQALLEEAVGDLDKAIELLQGLVKDSEQPGNQYTPGEANNRAVFLERLGLVYREQQKYESALQAFRQIVALGKEQAPRGEQLIVDTMRQNHTLAKALDDVDSAVRKFPGDRPLIILHAYVTGEIGRVDEAVKELQKLLDGSPADREIYLSVAQVYSQAKQYGKAEEAVNQALSHGAKPEDQEYAHFMLGSIYERQKKYDLAEDQFKKVLVVDPFNASAANYLGYMLADQGVRLEESVKYIQKALELDPNNGAYLDSLGWAYYKMDRYDLAELHLEKAARLMTTDPTIHAHLGSVYLRRGKLALAQQEWERAIKDWPHAESSDFDAAQAAKLQKELDDLKLRIANQHSGKK